MIRSLCRPETVPANFPSVFLNYAHQGFRVIAVAYKDMNMVYEPKATARRGTMSDDRKSNGATAGTYIAETCVSVFRWSTQAVCAVHVVRVLFSRLVGLPGTGGGRSA